jgi:hypothetical protein
MIKDRSFHIIVVSANHGAGIPLTEKPDAVVQYSGKKVTTKLP